MCGHVGLAGNLFQKHREALKDLLFLDTLRGKDSTGVATVTMGREIKTFKSLLPGHDFIEDTRFDQAINPGQCIWIGHNRAATVGKKSRLNAHPFISEDETMVGAHNGTITARWQCVDNHTQYDTDSEGVINMIRNRGWKDAIGKLTGAWALVVYDSRNHTLNFLRNKERPLFFALFKEHDGIIWASEEWMIEAVCLRRNIEIGKIYYFGENTLYTFPVGNTSKHDWSKWTSEKEVSGSAVAPFQGGNNWTGGQTSKTTTKEKEKPKANLRSLVLAHPNTTGGSTESQTISLGSTNGSWIKGYQGRLISRQELLTMMQRGCCWCEDEELSLSKPYAFLEVDEIICEKCLRDTHDKPYDTVNLDKKREC